MTRRSYSAPAFPPMPTMLSTDTDLIKLGDKLKDSVAASGQERTVEKIMSLVHQTIAAHEEVEGAYLIIVGLHSEELEMRTAMHRGMQLFNLDQAAEDKLDKAVTIACYARVRDLARSKKFKSVFTSPSVYAERQREWRAFTDSLIE